MSRCPDITASQRPSALLAPGHHDIGEVRYGQRLAAGPGVNVGRPQDLLGTFPSLAHGLVMVQAEVADRMTAPPGSRVYGVPSVKLAWYASARRAEANHASFTEGTP